MEKLESLIKTYNDFPKKGIAFKDLLGIIQDSEIFRELILRMSLNHVIKNSEAIISIEARGFIFGSAISLQARKPMIVARKPGKLPAAVERVEYALEYGTDSLEIHKDALQPGQRVLLADDLLATGGTISAAAQLVQRLDTIVHEAAFIIELEGLGGREKLSCPAFSLMRFTEE